MTSLFSVEPKISPAFIQQIRNFLEHFYNFPYQQKLTLILSTEDTGYPSFEIAGSNVRKLLLEALEKIGKEKNLAFRSSQARIYNLLRLHYIEGMEIRDVARELGLSQRQTYRDLRTADAIIASIVWSQLIEQISAQDPEPQASQTNDGARQQSAQPAQPTNLNELVAAVLDILRPLATSHEVEMMLSLPDRPVVVSTNSMVARQVVTSLLSKVVQKALPRVVTVTLSATGKDCTLRLAFRSALPEQVSDASIDLYARDLGWRIEHHVSADQDVEIEVSMQTYRRTCLIIDDHSEFVDLIERYMDSSIVQIVSADNGPKGIEIARQLQPEIIILDIMIPEIDGWQVLQTLHSAPATRSIPIIVCSVFYDPDLAQTLGAADVLKKPIRKKDLVAALKKFKIL